MASSQGLRSSIREIHPESSAAPAAEVCAPASHWPETHGAVRFIFPETHVSLRAPDPDASIEAEARNIMSRERLRDRR